MPVKDVLTKDTGRNISALLNDAGRVHGFDPAGLLGLIIAESGLHEHASREAAWPDVSYGLVQPAVKWARVPSIGLDGDNPDTPTTRAAARAYFFDAANAIAYAAPTFAVYSQRASGDALLACCLWNAPNLDWAHPDVQHAANKANYARSLQAAEAYRATEPTPQGGTTVTDVLDQRGAMPRIAAYSKRPLTGITGVTIHYTAGPTGQSARQVAAYQTSPAAAQQTGAGVPFPSLAYTLFVEADGTPILANDLDDRTWHSAASVGGVARNLSHVGICYAGDYQPSVAQIGGLARAIAWVQDQLGRTLSIEGHRDPGYPTSCPGPVWPAWKAAVEAALASLDAPAPAAASNPGWSEPGFGELWRQGVITGAPTSLPYSDALGNVHQEGSAGWAHWNKARNINTWEPWAA